MGKVFCKILIIAFILSYNYLLEGQEITKAIVAESPDSVSSGAETIKKHSFYSMTGYGSTAIYPGSTLEGSQKLALGSLIYSYRNKFFVSIGSIDLINNGIPADYINPSLIYTLNPTKWLDISVTGSAFRVNSKYADSLRQNFTLADITTGLNAGFMKTDISFSWLYSDRSNFFIQIRNSKYFQTRTFLNNRLSFSFNPYVKLLAGTHYRSVNESISSTNIVIDTIAVVLPVNQQTTDNNGNRTMNDPSLNYTTVINQSAITTTSVVTTLKNRFGLMEISAGIPVSINFRRVSVEAEAGYVLPAYSDELVPRPKGFIFMVTGLIRLF